MTTWFNIVGTRNSTFWAGDKTPPHVFLFAFKNVPTLKAVASYFIERFKFNFHIDPDET